MDSKTGMNLSSYTNSTMFEFNSGLNTAVASARTLKQEFRDLNQASSLMAGKLFQGFGGSTSGYMSANQVAPSPQFHNVPAISTTQVASGPPPTNVGGGGFNGTYSSGAGGNYSITGGGGGSRDLSSFVKGTPGAGVLYGAGVALGAANSTSDMVQAQLLTQRAMAYMPNAGNITSIQNPMLIQALGKNAPFDYASQSAMAMAAAGAANDKMDAYNALAAAQSYGITGPNFLQGAGSNSFNNSVAAGIANVSNLTPGLGLEGATRAYGTMQQASTVNMLRGVGISIRDSNGNLKPPDQIIDDLWAKITRDYSGAYGTGKAPSEKEVLIAFEPGNSLDSMIGNLFGTDPMVYNLVKNGLIFKARASGGNASSTASTVINQSNALDQGMTTAAVQSFNIGNATATQGLGLSMGSGAAAFSDMKSFLTFMGNQMNTTLPDVVKALNAAAAVTQTLGSAGNNMGGNLLGLLAKAFTPKAEGGPTLGRNTYLVGEKGPELFVPDTNGTIVPNDKLPFHYGGARAAGGSVEVTGYASDLLSGLGAPLTGNNLSNLISWMSYEGGIAGNMTNSGNNASYNPLDTTLTMPGSTSINSVGVQAYSDLKSGEQATISTLKQSNMKPIVDALLAGNVSWTDFQSVVGSTPWGTFKGAGSSSSSSSSSSSTSTFNDAIKAALTQSFGPQAASLYDQYLASGNISTSDLLGSTVASQSSAMSGLFGQNGGSGITNNYGGVTLNLNTTADPTQVKSMMQDFYNQLQTGQVVAIK